MTQPQEKSPGEAVWFGHSGAKAWRCVVPPESAYAFHVALPGYAPTPLVSMPTLADELGVADVLVKDESSRLGLPAFKVLGASWAVARLVAREQQIVDVPVTLEAVRAAAARHPLELVTATDGNHGRAVARMAAQLGLQAHVFVPDLMTERAAEDIAGEGATVTQVAGDYDEAVRLAAEYADRDDHRALVQDVSWPGYEQVPAWIVEGYGTMLVEVDAELAERGLGPPDLVVVPVGVGSLAQAVLWHYRSDRKVQAPAILSVEPVTAACVLASLEAGEPGSVSTEATVMAGLNCGTPSSAAWPYLRDGLDGAVAVDDADALRAVADLAENGLSSGPSGAATLAGARAVLSAPGSESRRASLCIDATSRVILLSTEGRSSARDAAPSAGTAFHEAAPR